MNSRFMRGSIISRSFCSTLLLPEPISFWSDAKTTRARLSLNERFSDRHECSVRVQPAGRPRRRRQISYQFTVISYQLSVHSSQLSVISYQLSVHSYQL